MQMKQFNDENKEDEKKSVLHISNIQMHLTPDVNTPFPFSRSKKF